MSAFLKNVQNFAAQHELWSRGSSMIVGVSGGPDSMCLLDTLILLAPKYDWKFRVAHVNYRLRGEDSDQDEELVAKTCKALNLPFDILRPETISASEATLRDIRYAWFETLRVRHNYESIAVAHTKNDQAETLLLRLLRGSGIDGLSGMHPKHDSIIRPFLAIDRQTILERLSERATPFRIDHSNADPKYTRNHIRHELIPLLRDNFAPHIVDILARNAESFANDSRLLQEFLHPKYQELLRQNKPYQITLLASHCQDLSDALLLRILKHAFLQASNHTLFSIEQSHLRQTLKLIRSQKNKVKSLTFDNFTVLQRGNTITIAFTP